MYVGILKYAGRRYLWWALLLVAVSLALYFSQSQNLPRSGGSWQGYALGVAGALLIIWLAWLGLRKRRYRSNRGTLLGWASAHVYLGLALLVVATLHTAFQFGWNIHTLAYALMVAVILSGLCGLVAYLRLPAALVGNRGNQSTPERLAELDEIDQQAQGIAARCDDATYALVHSALERTALSHSFSDQLRARDRSRVLRPADEGSGRRKPKEHWIDNPDQRVVIDYLTRRIPDTSKRGEAERLRELLYVFGRRAEILQRLRRETAIQLRLKLWLCFHIPLTIALLVALAAHIVAVFFYW